MFLLYAMLYSLARFFLEYLRGDYTNLIWGLKSAQWTSLIVLGIAFTLFVWSGYNQKKSSL